MPRPIVQGKHDRPLDEAAVDQQRLVPVRLVRRLVEYWVEHRKQQQRLEEEQEATRKALLGAFEDDSVVFIPPERLTLGREIGRGRMGVVRAATFHPSEEVAVKMLPMEVLSQDASMAFRREVKVLQRGSTFCHNVCRFLAVMFNYEQSLEDFIKLAPNFGISAAVEHTLSARKATSILGSVHNMAPEQHDPDESSAGVTVRADAWSFGCMLVAMATGLDPWEGLQVRQVITNVLVKRQTPPVPTVLPDALKT
eukprot:jgi/Mesvir1/15827/Mv03380-RA.1